MLPFEIKSDTSKGHPLWPGGEDTLKFTHSPERLCNILIKPRLPSPPLLISSQFFSSLLYALLAVTNPPYVPPKNYVTPWFVSDSYQASTISSGLDLR